MLESLFTRPAVVKVLDFLLELWELDFSMADISRETGLTWSVVAEVMPIIEKFGLVKVSRTVGRAKLYKVNEDSPIIKALIATDLGISEISNKEWAAQKVGIYRLKKRTTKGNVIISKFKKKIEA